MEQAHTISEEGSSGLHAERDESSKASTSLLDNSNSPTSSPDDHTVSSVPLEVPEKSLEEILASLSITTSPPQPPKDMFRALASIFQASQMHEGGMILNQPDGNGIWTVLHGADEAEGRGERDVLALRSVRGVLDQMLWARSQLLLPATRIMADASRDPSWRLPFGEGGILNFALGAVASNSTSSDLQLQSLRLIGNACADTDENRHRVVSSHYLQMIMTSMEDPRLTSIAVPVVYNICTDYEPGQQQATTGGLLPAVIRVLESENLSSSPAISYACRLLDISVDGLDPLHSPENAVEVLLRAATLPELEVDDCASLVDAAVAHLQAEQFQQHMVSHDLLGIPLKLLIRSYFPHANLTGPRLPSISSMATVMRNSEEEAELTRFRKSLISALSDVTSLPEFATKHAALNTPLIDALVKWLSAALPQLQLCSCIVLGNLAQSDRVCDIMVARLQLHTDLILILRSSSDSQVVHSVLGFLRNLSLPNQSKNVIGEAGAVEALARFLSADSLPQVSHAAAALVRQLVNSNLSNTQRLLAPLSADEESPASSKTYLSLLLALYNKSDDIAIKTEVARVIAAILRCLHSSTIVGSPTKDEILHRLLSLHPNIATPLGMMVAQSKYPVIRSEGWFAMALMARSTEGAAVLSNIISEVKVFTALEETIRGPSSSSSSSVSSTTPTTDPHTPLSPEQSMQPREMRTKDRENAMILVNELLQNRDEDLEADIRRSALEDLLQAGSRVDRQ